jgi:hypothetical protein
MNRDVLIFGEYIQWMPFPKRFRTEIARVRFSSPIFAPRRLSGGPQKVLFGVALTRPFRAQKGIRVRIASFFLAGVLSCLLCRIAASESDDGSSEQPGQTQVRQWTYNGRTYVLPGAQEAARQAEEEGYMTEYETQPKPMVQASTEPAPESSWFGTVLLAVIVTAVLTMVGMIVLGNPALPVRAQPISAVVVAPKRTPETSTSITVTRNRKVREYTAGASSSSLIFPDNRTPAERAADDNVPTDRISTQRIADDAQFSSEEPANITSRIAAKHRETQRRSKSAV